ncbi:MBL fold metallo-hydrolase [Fulvivirgaceae bacterium BMA10]|uniref:MBL fold metallo-hydrolase n=1 Tax=Splendidivirga corallicola TaxID=3051826 RepID=A0ABT8KNJ3_9BACT|nr:MBL fold metallo-hydrolase [Fulvivirgaceae bacterium BMA10]
MKKTNTLNLFILLAFLFLSCNTKEKEVLQFTTNSEVDVPDEPFMVVLGIAQDAGYPQAGCQKACCELVYQGKNKAKLVSCIAVVDPISNEKWIFDATPDFKEQLHALDEISPDRSAEISGIFLTHGHIGHYTGLMHLGREVMGAENIPVYAMPRMASFLSGNGPWSQLVNLNNIEIKSLKADSSIVLNERISVTAFLVPHRDEFTETVGYKIQGPGKSFIFIPDIDKWGKWERDINALIENTDYAFLDGSFFENGEIPGRDMNEIPHPFIAESIERFGSLLPEDKGKVHFIHFNHTNPVLIEGSEARKKVIQRGFKIAREMQVIPL